VSSLNRLSSPRASWWITFVLVGVVGTCWALASPPYSAVDEPLHVIKAVSIARGQWVGDMLAEDQIPADAVYRNGWATFKVPEIYGEAEEASRCFRGADHISEPANCFSFSGSTESAEIASLDPRYPPAYYLAVGLPTRLVPDGPNAVRVMRLISVAVFAAFVASAASSLRRLSRPKPALLGLLVALTPMALHLAASVNPSGVEIGAAIALWASGAILIREAPDSTDPRLVIRAGVAGVVLVLTRPASPVFGLLIGVALLALANRSGVRALVRARSAQLAAAAIAIAAAFQVGWNQLVQPNYYGTPIPDVVPRSDVIRFATGKTIGYYQQAIGVFGAPEFSVNTFTIILWSLLLGGLLFAAVTVARRRVLLVMAGVLAIAIVMPITADVSQADRFTYAWQGRYTIPLIAGLPILAGIAIASRPASDLFSRRRVLVVFGFTFTLAQFLAFAEFLQRYTVGVDGVLLFAFEPAWSPPVHGAILLFTALASLIGLSAVLMADTGRGRQLPEQLPVLDSLAASDGRPVEQDTGRQP